MDHSGQLHLLRLFPFQPPVNPGPMDLARGSVIERLMGTLVIVEPEASVRGLGVRPI
jgi:hypothetical protein